MTTGNAQELHSREPRHCLAPPPSYPNCLPVHTSPPLLRTRAVNWMTRSERATMMLFRTAGAGEARRRCAKRGTAFLARPSSTRHSLPSAVQACAWESRERVKEGDFSQEADALVEPGLCSNRKTLKRRVSGDSGPTPYLVSPTRPYTPGSRGARRRRRLGSPRWSGPGRV